MLFIVFPSRGFLTKKRAPSSTLLFIVGHVKSTDITGSENESILKILENLRRHVNNK